MKPILFSTPEVQALLNTKPNAWPAEPIDGEKPHKCQTRRVIKPQPHDVPEGAYINPYYHNYEHFTVWTHDHKMCLHCGGNIKNTAHWKPQYQPGDILSVRETFFAWGRWANVIDIKSMKMRKKFFHMTDGEHPYRYCADGLLNTPPAGAIGYWKLPSIHMPRKAARIFLEVKAVRAERLQEITTSDAEMEGMIAAHMSFWDFSFARDKFSALWDFLYAKRGNPWESNPWVWVYEFMRCSYGHSDNSNG